LQNGRLQLSESLACDATKTTEELILFFILENDETWICFSFVLAPDQHFQQLSNLFLQLFISIL